MQFQKKTRLGSLGSVSKLLVKLIIIILILFGFVIVIDKINFPSPNKKIEQQIPNEKFEIIK